MTISSADHVAATTIARLCILKSVQFVEPPQTTALTNTAVEPPQTTALTNHAVGFHQTVILARDESLDDFEFVRIEFCRQRQVLAQVLRQF